MVLVAVVIFLLICWRRYSNTFLSIAWLCVSGSLNNISRPPAIYGFEMAGTGLFQKQLGVLTVICILKAFQPGIVPSDPGSLSLPLL